MRIIALVAAALALTASLATAAPFQLVDRNNDGQVSKREFIRNYGPELDVFQFRVIDENKDGYIDAAEFLDARNESIGILND